MGGRPWQVEALQLPVTEVGEEQPDMKGERRHELERNELADWLVKVFEKIKPYQNAILGAVLLVLVALVAYKWWAGQATGKQVAAWDGFHQAVWRLSQGTSSPTECAADFEAIAADYPDTEVALWARTMAADLHLAAGCDALFHNKGIANQQLREAVDHYLTILESDNSGSELRQRATFGLARACESQGDLEKAMEHYEQLGRNWPEGAYAAAAAGRLEDLKRVDTKRLYDQFAKFDPRPASSPEGGVPGERPAFEMDSLEEDETLFEPKFLDLEEKGTEDGVTKKPPDTPAEPGESRPDEPDTGPEDTEPADTEPGDPDPADTESAGAGATDADSNDAGATVSQQTEPADSAEPPINKSE